MTCRIGVPGDVLGDFGFYYLAGDTAEMAKAIEKALIHSDTFSYRKGFIEQHSWKARAKEFAAWIKGASC